MKKNNYKFAVTKIPPVCLIEYDKVINSNKMMMNADTNNYNNNYIDSHKGENRHSKNIGQQSVKELE